MTKAKLRNANFSAQKGRLVADQIRNKPVEQALNLLTFSNKKAATIVDPGSHGVRSPDEAKHSSVRAHRQYQSGNPCASGPF